ncbi:acetylcholinesterase-like protein [Dermatophagoides farinae]|uniref:Acetylcholinesterase-like protein n=1 Tax=Dermatophagoides farinae TaxID=6954 RepID=A0A9D4SC29_DERFA|nr:acetylcholinesterase-like protein [Dermatophagoides farinae]
MTTFTTKNQSRKRWYRLIGAAIVIIILVTLIILSRRDRNNVSNTNASSSLSTSSIFSNSQRDPSRSKTDGKRRQYYSDEMIEYEPLIQLPGIHIKGQVRTVANGKLVASYLSIPYAEPPVDHQRLFRPPQLKQFNKNNKNSTLEAFYQPIKCYQSTFVLSITEVKGLGDETKEDCLFLNIWTPFKEDGQNNKTTKMTGRPVMVFIHGGIFQFGGIGSPELDPSLLVAEKDIIVITMQYRLGVFGFGSSVADENNDNFRSLGLQDQAKALEWIHKYIRSFGGDSNQVTVVGHGAGAISLGFHLMNKDTNKYFKRAVLQGVQGIWNIGIYGMNTKSVPFLMEDSNCDDETVSARDIRACMEKSRIQSIVFMEGQQYLIDKFAIPFVPDYNPLTKQIWDQAKNMVSESRFNDSLLEIMFNKWNIYSPDHEILLGLNSDDDYQFEKYNKITTYIKFGDSSEDDYEYDDETGDNDSEEETEESNNNSAVDEEEDDEKKPSNDTIDDAKNNNKDDGDDNDSKDEEDDETSDTSDNNENKEMDNNSSSSTTTTASKAVAESNSKIDNNKDEAEESNDGDYETEEEEEEERRRRRSLKRKQRQTLEPSKLDKDEMVKLCRLVKMYHVQQEQNSPKGIAFGSKTNHWLKGLEKYTMNIWGSFATNGLAGLRMSESELSTYDSKIGSTNGPVNLINVGQAKDDENDGQISIRTFDWKQLCPVQMY